MSSVLATIQEKIERLSPQKQAQVVDFIEFLLSKETPRKPRKLTFNWADGPGDPPEALSSVELQHEATNLRVKDETTD